MILNWIIIGVFVMIALFFLQMEHHTRKLKALVFAILGLALYFSLLGMMSSNEVNIDSPKGIVNAVYTYFGWIGETSTRLWDIGKDTTSMVGHAIKLNVTDEGVRPRR